MINRDILLIVDDVKMNRAILKGMFESQYRTMEADNGSAAMQLMEQYNSEIAVVLLDLIMPVMDGYQVMQEMNRRGYISEMPVIIITADSSSDSEIKAFDAGASDVIAKPFEAHIVRRRVHNVVELNQRKLMQDELIEEQAAKLRKSNAGIIATLASIVETRSLETGLHIKRISLYVKVLLDNVAANFPEYMLDARRIDIITDAASLHDIGKIAIPDAVLNKPGKLTPEEYDVMKTHTTKGCEILDSLTDIADKEYLQYAYNICRYHHERWDGRGYPDGLRGDAIPICAQVVGIADCYDALTNDRVYKKAIEPAIAVSMILNGECGIFSPRLMESLKAVQDEFISLASAYSDASKTLSGPSFLRSSRPALNHRAKDVQHSDSLKYFALLNYVRANVVEVDLNTGVYQLVYQYSSDFDLLKSGKSFEDSIRRFTEGAVHPDDRSRVLEILDSYTNEFFAQGLLQTQRSYRIYNRASGEYRTWQASMTRIDPDSPQQQRVLLIWRPMEETETNADRKALAENMVLQNMIVDVQQCMNDKWLTMPYASPGLLNLLGYDAEEVSERFGNHYVELIHPDDRERVLVKCSHDSRKGKFQEMEYRLVGKDGSVFWILEKSQLGMDAGGRERFYCVLIDITRSKATEEDLRSLIERYQIIIDQTTDVIFEWRSEDDRITFSPSWSRRFGYGTDETGIMGRRLYTRHMPEEDAAVFEDMLNRLRAGRRYDETDVRLMDSSGKYRWCRFRITVMLGQDDAIKRAVGLISDIDSEKKAFQELRSMAERDSLTQLYNKKVARKKIDDYVSAMSPDDSAAMFVIDVDDFKSINDRYGHTLGDTVLQKIAAELQGVFRSHDIVARIGGDEFLVFMTSVRDRQLIENRAARVNSILRSIITETIPDHNTSCSIGLVLCPSGGRSFDELFIHGDLAMYAAKRAGKNGHMFYSSSMENSEFEVPASLLASVNEND